MNEASKKRMEQLGQKAANAALIMCELVGYPTCDEPLCLLVDETFQNGYKAGMQDPEANSERIKQLEGLLGECEKYIHRIKDHSVSKGYLNVVGLSRQMIYLIDEYKELKAAKEGINAST